MNAQDIKLVVADMDGTLLNGEHKLSENTIQTVQALVKQGTEFMLATGRHYQDVYLMAQQLGVEACLITSNGARVHNAQGEILYENHMPAGLVKQVLSLSRGFELHRNVYQQDLWLVEEPHEALLAIHDQSGFRYQMADFEQTELCLVDKIYFTAEHSVLEPLEQLLLQEVGDQLSITFTSPEYLEVMNKGVSKGQALQKVLQQKGFAAEEVIAFGDGMNDVSMLALVGKGVVMGNASDSVKQELPQLEVTLSNAEEGVASYLQQHLIQL